MTGGLNLSASDTATPGASPVGETRPREHGRSQRPKSSAAAPGGEPPRRDPEEYAGRQSRVQVPEHQDLTTQRAANIVVISRPFMVQLLEEDNLPFHMVGSHRRVYLKDVRAYKARRDKERHTSIARMARMEKKAGTYDKVVLPPGAEDQ